MIWLAVIYLIGFVIVAVVSYGVVASEPTAHGQSILIPLGCLATVFWPVALAWVAIISALDWARGGLGRDE